MKNEKTSLFIASWMKGCRLPVMRLGFLALGLVAFATALARPASAEIPEATRQQVIEAYGKLPLSFETNLGQTDGQVKFLSRGSGYTLFLTSTEAVLTLRTPVVPTTQHAMDAAPVAADGENTQVPAPTVLRMQLVGANPAPQMEGLEEPLGKSNYFIGNDPEKWRTNIPHYARVTYRAIYPGIDLVYYGNQRQLEYDFIVTPGADPQDIRLGFRGADTLALDDEGNLILHTAGGEVLQRAPVIYQEINGTKKRISGRYVLHSKDQVTFQVAAYDTTKPLIIDPVLSYSTFLGGSGRDLAFDIAVDAAGNAYVTGLTGSINFPGTAGSLIQAAFGGGLRDAFVTKVNAAGSALVYSTYLGGLSTDVGRGIAVDADGNAYVTGQTDSPNFPGTAGSLIQAAFGGGVVDAFVTKVNATGSALVYSTYLGGGLGDLGTGIAVDADDNAYVTGITVSINFPGTAGSLIQAAFGGGFFDAFVTKVNAAGSALDYSAYLGGSGTDQATGIAVDAAGNAYVTGLTGSTNFPGTAGSLIQAAFGGGSVRSLCF